MFNSENLYSYSFSMTLNFLTAHQETLKNTLHKTVLAAVSSVLMACSNQIRNIPIEDATSSEIPAVLNTMASNTLSKQDVQEIQKQLNIVFKDSHIKVDGIYESQTKKYITDFQNICMKVTQGYIA